MELFGNNYHEMIIDLKSTLQLVSVVIADNKIEVKNTQINWDNYVKHT